MEGKPRWRDCGISRGYVCYENENDTHLNSLELTKRLDSRQSWARLSWTCDSLVKYDVRCEEYHKAKYILRFRGRRLCLRRRPLALDILLMSRDLE
jgi:hypothetical protein